MKLRTTGWSKALTTTSARTQAKTPSHHWLYYWGPALLWLAMVAIFSSQGFAAANTSGGLAWFLRTFHLDITGRHFLLLHGLIRKSAHFSVYGLLSALFFRAWRGGAQLLRWKWSWAVLSLLVCLGTASADEIHQHFTPGRTGAVSDVVLDMMGALFAQVMIVVGSSSRRRLKIN